MDTELLKFRKPQNYKNINTNTFKKIDNKNENYREYLTNYFIRCYDKIKETFYIYWYSN